MRTLITGIDGFVGSHLAEYLLGIGGVEVHGIVVDPGKTPNLTHVRSSLTLHRADVLDSGQILQLVSTIRPERILHLAGQAYVPASFDDPASTFHTNIIGGVSVLEAARKTAQQGNVNPSVLIVSTGEVYGRVEPPERQPITEESPLAPNNPYAASKAGIDLIAQQYHRSFGVDVIVVRPFNHAGPRQSPIFVCSDFGKQLAEIALGKRAPTMKVGNIDTKRDFTDVRDVVRAYWSLFDRNSDNDVFNVCSGRAIAIREILDMLRDIAGVSVDVVREQHRVRPYDVPMVVGSYDRLKRATGWSPSIPIRKTLEDVFEDWRKREESGG
jgi:GDP-4-dehydro-6-deoxy-D-mannose reductase